MSITDEQMNVIVSEGIQFIRAITEAYGSDEGMQLWETIASTLDPAVKGKIFFAMLTGSHDDRVTMSGASNGRKIECIKYIREYTGYGLIDAKNAYETAVFGPITLTLIDPKLRSAFISDLRNCGMHVT